MENMFKTYREVIDEMGKVSLNKTKTPRKSRFFKMGKSSKTLKSVCFGRSVEQIEKFHYRCASFLKPDRSR